eukprot:UN05439
MLKICNENNLKLSVEKTIYAAISFPFLGCIFDDGKILIDPDKAKDILSVRAPVNVKEMQMFIGSIIYIAKFIPNIMNYLAVLIDLVSKYSNI